MKLWASFQTVYNKQKYYEWGKLHLKINFTYFRGRIFDWKLAAPILKQFQISHWRCELQLGIILKRGFDNKTQIKEWVFQREGFQCKYKGRDFLRAHIVPKGNGKHQDLINAPALYSKYSMDHRGLLTSEWLNKERQWVTWHVTSRLWNFLILIWRG